MTSASVRATGAHSDGEDNPAPLVSVVICTYSRPAGLRRALRSVLLQDQQNIEVIVIDDGSNPPVELPARDGDRVRLIRTAHRAVGAARAEGLNAARGQFTAYCDDDDEWAPDHLRVLLSFLRENPKVDLVYSDTLCVLGEEPPWLDEALDYDQALLSTYNYIPISSVLHRASAARDAGGFDPSLQAYEDWDLWRRMSRGGRFWHLPLALASRYWQADCVAATDHREDWERVVAQGEPVRGLPAADDTARPPLRVPFNADTWTERRRQLIWHSVMRAHEGYGSVGRQLLLALERQGVAITMAPTRDQPPTGFERFYRPPDAWNQLGFYYDYQVRPTTLQCERVISYSMWESTLVPSEHVEQINAAATLHYVPCAQNLESFRQRGVRAPMKVLHHGVDEKRFPYLQRARQDAFTFGTLAIFLRGKESMSSFVHSVMSFRIMKQ